MKSPILKSHTHPHELFRVNSWSAPYCGAVCRGLFRNCRCRLPCIRQVASHGRRCNAHTPSPAAPGRASSTPPYIRDKSPSSPSLPFSTQSKRQSSPFQRWSNPTTILPNHLSLSFQKIILLPHKNTKSSPIPIKRTTNIFPPFGEAFRL